VEPGSLTITRPWQRHRVGNPNAPACHYSWRILDVGMRRPNQSWHWPDWLLYPKTGLSRLTDVLRQNEQPVWRADAKIGNCFARLDEPWTLDSMAEACGLGRTHYATYCRKLANVTPVEYLTRRWLGEASRILAKHPEMSVTEIAFRCGFQCSQYFFRGRYGHSPSGHRGREA